VRIDLGAGASSAVIYGSDLSTEYVVNNSEYTT
jgi:N-acetylglutamate synthase/N-acetylornithine aminotransferase